MSRSILESERRLKRGGIRVGEALALFREVRRNPDLTENDLFLELFGHFHRPGRDSDHCGGPGHLAHPI